MDTKYQNFKKNIYKPNSNKRLLFDQLKFKYSFREQDYIISKLPKIFEPLIFGKPILKSLTEFDSKKRSYYDSEEAEMNWLIHLFKKHCKELNEFISKKTEFEKQFLLGEYDQSKKILNHVKSISHSYWGIENDFLQTQYEEGLEFNFKLLNKNKDQHINDPCFFLLIHFFSNKVEEDISYLSYINSIENCINRGMSDDYKSYFSYRLNPINHDYTNFGGLLWITSNLSLIDKYIIYKDVVAHIFSHQKLFEKYNFVKEHSNYLSSYIIDPFLDKANILTGSNIKNKCETDTDEIVLLDLFTEGKYEDVILNAKKILFKQISFTIIEIFVKSYIYLEREIEEIGNKDNVLNIIVKLTHKILSRSKHSNEAIVEILTIANAISSFDLAKEIITFISYHISKEEKIESIKNAFLFSKNYNPLHYVLFSDINAQKKYLENVFERNSSTAIFFKSIIENDHLNENKEISIPVYRKKFYIAKDYYNKGDYKSFKIEIEKIYTEVGKVAYIKEQCVKMLFFSFIKLEEYDNAIDLYVDNYILNPFIVSKIKPEELAEIIIRKRWNGITSANINFPIFMYLCLGDIHPKYIAYDLYMRTQNIDFPSELNNCKDIELSKKIFFLKNVANQKIISRKAIVFKNSTAVLNERISICQILSKIDTSIDEYKKEISDITQRLTVQQRIKEIDESKIYIDEVGILENELDEVQKSFNRFKNISQLLKESSINVTGIEYDALYDLLKGKIDAEAYRKSRRKTDFQFKIFTQLFLEIRDKFLFSNQYGLDYYLSQRIRHGTIINQVRKSFKTHNLVTTRSSKNDEYLTNDYWLSKLELHSSEKGQFVERMNLFSSNIDNIISNLKNKYIQIKTEDPKTKQTGWFDYMYIPIWDESYLYTLYVKELQFTTDFNEFVKPMFEVLWQMTERNLSFVREKMNSEIKIELIKELDLLEIDLKRILVNVSTSSIYRAIADCRTNVQADIDYAIRWFNKSKNDEIDFTIEDALNTSLQIVNNIISPNVLYVQREINTNQTLIKGTYFTHFVDLIKIFLTNISDYYSKIEIQDKKTSIVISQVDDLLILEFSNSLKDDEDIEELKKIINEKQALELTNNKGIRGEGSTGFPKANNILKNVFRNNNKISFQINEKKFVVKCEILLGNLIV